DPCAHVGEERRAPSEGKEPRRGEHRNDVQVAELSSGDRELIVDERAVRLFVEDLPAELETEREVLVHAAMPVELKAGEAEIRGEIAGRAERDRSRVSDRDLRRMLFEGRDVPDAVLKRQLAVV